MFPSAPFKHQNIIFIAADPFLACSQMRSDDHNHEVSSLPNGKGGAGAC